MAIQVSCLGLEESEEGDPCKFILTSRSTNGTLESLVLHSSHPGVCEVWTLQISQILESQRNFLNGEPSDTRTEPGVWWRSCFCTWLSFLHRLTALTSPIEYQRNHVGAGVGAQGGGVGGVSPTSSAPSVPQSVSRRPSKIPQPSRLPQPLRHLAGADAEGPNKMLGTERRPLAWPALFSRHIEGCD